MATTAHLPFLDGRARLTIGINTADLGHLADEVRVLEDARAEIVHVDVMDGVFCPATTVGPPFIKAIRTPLLKDAHLMIVDPIEKVADYVAAGADIVTFQVESTRHSYRGLQVLGKAENANDPARGIVRGVALNPGTPVSAVEPLLDEIGSTCSSWPSIPAGAARSSSSPPNAAWPKRKVLSSAPAGRSCSAPTAA